MKTLFILFLSFSLQIAYSQKIEPCSEIIPCREKNPEIFIFIGKKINISPVKQPRFCYTIGSDPKSNTTLAGASVPLVHTSKIKKHSNGYERDVRTSKRLVFNRTQ